MIKKKKILIILIIIFMIILSSCQNNEVIKEAKEDKITIGFAMDTLKEERWQKDRDIFVAEAEKLGAEVLVLAANGDDQKQIEQAKYLLNEGADILVVVPHNAKIAEKIVTIAHRKGVKVIAYDRLINGNVDYYISFDNKKVGDIQGKYLTEKLKIKEGNVVYIGGAKTDNNALLFRKGFIEIADKYENLNIVYDEYSRNWNLSEARKHMENALTLYDDIDAVVCANDAIAGVVSSLLAERQIKLPITGQDAEISACQRIVEDKQSMTVYKDVRLLASKAAKMAVDTVKGVKINTGQVVENDYKKVKSILLEPVYVDKNNMMELIIKGGFHKFEDVYRNIPKEEQPEN